MRLTNMTLKEITATNNQIKELKNQYFEALDNFNYELATSLDKEIVRLNNSIR